MLADWTTPSERVLARSKAVLHALRQLGGTWAALAWAGDLVPRPLADLLYRAVARNRYRIFGRHDSCPIPPAAWRERFIDQ